MSNVNTDERVVAAQVAPIAAPTAATITYFQFSALAAPRTGAAIVNIPGQYKATNKKLKVRAYGHSKLATTTSQVLTVTINAVNTAGTVAIVATSGAVACASMAGAVQGWYLEAEILLDPTASAIMAGEYQGVALSGSSSALVARAIMTNQPGFTQTTVAGTAAAQGFDDVQGFEVAVTQAVADSTAVHTITELSCEVL